MPNKSMIAAFADVRWCSPMGILSLSHGENRGSSPLGSANDFNVLSMITMAVSNKRPIYRRVREWTRLDIHVAFGVPIERPAQRRSTVDFRTEFDTGPQLSLGGIRALADERKLCL